MLVFDSFVQVLTLLDMKRVLFLFLAVISVSGLHATGLCDKKIVVKSGGVNNDYPVKSIRSIKFSNGNVLFHLIDGRVETWDTESVGCMYINDCEPSVGTAVGTMPATSAYLNDGVLILECVSPVHVVLAAIDGTVLMDTVCSEVTVISLKEYPKGVYILKAGGCIHKIINR